jgi:hypothetical protein
VKEKDMTVMASWELFEDIRDAQDELLRMNRTPAQRLNLFGHQHHPSMSIPPWTPAVEAKRIQMRVGGGHALPAAPNEGETGS